MNASRLFLQVTGLLSMLTTLFGLLVCGAIVVSCICRLNAAKVARGRVSFTQLMYLAFATWAFGTFMELTVMGLSMGWHQYSVGIGILIHLHLTYKQWAGEDVIGDLAHWEDGHASPSNG